MPVIKEGTLNSFYNTSPTQYVIPPYQRTITWPLMQWEKLLNDIFRIMDDPKKTHLIQMFQLQGDSTETKFIVGDGQQRLVHTSLILLALAHSLKEISQMKEIAGSIIQYELAATYSRIIPDGDSYQSAMLSFYTDGARKPKVVVGPGNQKVYEALVFWDYDSLPKDRAKKCIVQHAFEFYKKELTYFLVAENINSDDVAPEQLGIYDYAIDLGGNLELINRKAKKFLNAMEYRLVFASAHFKSREEMQSSYESTNNHSIPLTESELIKNNIFQNFNSIGKQEELVVKYWQFFDNNYWINKELGERNLCDKNDFKRPKIDRLDDLFYYHLIASMGKWGAFSRKDTNAVFFAFKSFYDHKIKSDICKEKDSFPLDSLDEFNEKKFISDYYENILKTIRKQGEIYQKLENGYIDKNDRFLTRSNEFYHRIIFSCNMQGAISLLFMLIENNVSYERFDAVLSIFESFIIRKVLSSNNYSSQIYNTFFEFIENNVSIAEIKSRLSKDNTKLGAWEGDYDIIQNQMTKLWKHSEYKLASMLITDYENNIDDTIYNKLSYSFDSSHIEKFMPENSPNKNYDWPIYSSEPGERERLVYNFGNMFIIPEKIHRKLGNLSFKQKKNILSQSLNDKGSLGLSSLDLAYNSTKWGKIEIENQLRERLDRILEKYSGPKRTINKNEGSPLLVDGIVEPNQDIYYLSHNSKEYIATIQEDGSILYDGLFYNSFKDLMKVIDPEEQDKNYLSLWSREMYGTPYLLPLNTTNLRKRESK